MIVTDPSTDARENQASADDSPEKRSDHTQFMQNTRKTEGISGAQGAQEGRSVREVRFGGRFRRAFERFSSYNSTKRQSVVVRKTPEAMGNPLPGSVGRALAMMQETSRPSQLSLGNYDLLEKVAEGGMGTVYKGRHRETGQIVAIKVLAPHTVGNPVLMKRFEQEYNAARQLDHPNIVRALEIDNTGSTPYMVMEFVEGESLGSKLEREGRLPEAEAKRLIIQVAQGLYKAHKQRLVHRDVKPDNILLNPDGQAKLADLGLVKEVETDLNLTRTGRGLGTPNFMAPEQFRNAKNADARCDIYSLGATLYMMVTGETPFKAYGPLESYMKKIENDLVPPRQLVPELSERIDWAIQRAMSADPEGRPATCREFVEDLTGRSTRKVPGSENAASGQHGIWYLVFKDDEGSTRTMKGTIAGIRRSLKEGVLGDAGDVRASRTKSGEFQVLRAFPEFRDLVITPAPPAVAGGRASAAAAKAGKARAAQDMPTVVATPALSQRAAPHIPMDPGRSSTTWQLFWLQGLLWLLVAGATAVAGYFLFSTSK
jgi:serine/threonine protein kinase